VAKGEKIGRDPGVRSNDTPKGMLLLLKTHTGTRARELVDASD